MIIRLHHFLLIKTMIQSRLLPNCAPIVSSATLSVHRGVFKLNIRSPSTDFRQSFCGLINRRRVCPRRQCSISTPTATMLHFQSSARSFRRLILSKTAQKIFQLQNMSNAAILQSKIFTRRLCHWDTAKSCNLTIRQEAFSTAWRLSSATMFGAQTFRSGTATTLILLLK